MEVLRGEPQCIHEIVKGPKDVEFLLSIIYARPTFEVRQQLWRKLEDFDTSLSLALDFAW